MKTNEMVYVNIIIKHHWVNEVGQYSLIYGLVELHDVIRVQVKSLEFGVPKYLRGCHYRFCNL